MAPDLLNPHDLSTTMAFNRKGAFSRIGSLAGPDSLSVWGPTGPRGFRKRPDTVGETPLAAAPPRQASCLGAPGKAS